jgi:ABC-type phosphate transport system substrate-binding protein
MRIGVLLALWLTCGRQGVSVAQEGNPLMVIVSKANAGVSSLNRTDLKKILLGDKTAWPNGSKIAVILNSPGSPDRLLVLRTFCGMSESEFTRHQMQVGFAGGTPAVIKDVETAAQLKAALRITPGAIGFAHEKDVDDSMKVVLAVD